MIQSAQAVLTYQEPFPLSENERERESDVPFLKTELNHFKCCRNPKIVH